MLTRHLTTQAFQEELRLPGIWFPNSSQVGGRRSVGGDPAPSLVAAQKTKGTHTVPLAGWHIPIFFANQPGLMLCRGFLTFCNQLSLAF